MKEKKRCPTLTGRTSKNFKLYVISTNIGNMKELIKTLLGLLLIAGVGFALGLGYSRKTARKPVDLRVIWDTTEVVRHDTIVREKPVFVASSTIRHDTVRFTTLERDTVFVDVPIERRVYHEDSLYHAVVSGFRPSLDTLMIFPKTTTITITNTIPQAVRKRWSFGATLGPSVLATPLGQVHAGLGASVGLTYNF